MIDESIIKEQKQNKAVDDYLDEIDYTWEGYVPTIEALRYSTFIQEVNGGAEDNKTPIVHLAMMDKVFNKKKRSLVLCHRGLAKLGTLKSGILTPSGWTTMGEIKVGDSVITRDGKSAIVDYKTEEMEFDTYEIVLSDGSSFEVGDEHNNIVWMYRKKEREKVLTTKQLLKRQLFVETKNRKDSKEPKRQYTYSIPLVSPIEFKHKEFDIEPYVLGYGIANGYLKKGTISSHKDDIEEIRSYICELGYDCSDIYNVVDTNSSRFNIRGGVYKSYSELISRTKRIPKEYFLGSIKQRTELLKGLMDGDGSISKNGSVSYSSFNRELAEDVRDLARSLGAISYVKEYSRIRREDVELESCTAEYVVTINIKINPFKLKRKADRWKPTKKNSRAIVDIKPLGKQKGHCIHVDDSTHSYLTDGYTVTHNTTLFAEYLFLHIAAFGYMPGFGKVNLALYVTDSIENGVKNLRRNIEHRYSESEAMQAMVPNRRIMVGNGRGAMLDVTDEDGMEEFARQEEEYQSKNYGGRKFTDIRLEFENYKGHKFVVKGYGAASGVRGSKEMGMRPQLCHKKGTIVTTDIGTHKVEDYYKCGDSRIEKGKIVTVSGVIEPEVVTNEHRYMAMQIISKRIKKYLEDGKTKSETTYEYTNNDWIEAKNIKVCKKTGNQTIVDTYLAKKIDYTISDVKPIKCFNNVIKSRNENGTILKSSKVEILKIKNEMLLDEFWWLYGLWLADGHVSKTQFGYSIANTQEHTVGLKVLEYAKACGFSVTKKVEKNGCYQVNINSSEISRWMKEYKRGNSIKDIPEWVLKLDLEKQKQLLLGYIAGDGYVTKKSIRINSINKKVLEQLGTICERLGISFHIRNAKKEGITKFKSGYCSNHKHQYEIMIRDGVRNALGIDVDENPLIKKEVIIKDGFIYRKVKEVADSELEEFIPIQTPDHTYVTSFGISHNCVFDDIISDEDARSPTIIQTIEDTVYKAVSKALDPTRQKQVWLGTPFNQNDPIYKAAESGRWEVACYPIAEDFDATTTREDFRGSWEERFNYDYVKDEFDTAMALGRPDDFYKELMLRIANSDDRLIPEKSIARYDRNRFLLENKDNLYYYITTDAGVSENKTADFSVIQVWGVSHDKKIYLVDWWLGKVKSSEFLKELFKMTKKWKKNLQGVGIEVNGQQKGTISFIEEKMIEEDEFFFLLSENGNINGEKGIRNAPGMKKYDRFKAIEPWFSSGKIVIPEGYKDDEFIIEFDNEIKLVSKTNTGRKIGKARHDDVLDAIAMLGVIEIINPPKDLALLNKEPEDVKPVEFRFLGRKIDFGNVEKKDNKNGYSSYLN